MTPPPAAEATLLHASLREAGAYLTPKVPMSRRAIDTRRSRSLLVASALLLVLFTVQFAGWQVVGTPTL